jgi:hypothetical protein
MSKGVRSKRLWLVIDMIRAKPRRNYNWLDVYHLCKDTWPKQGYTPQMI